MWCDMDELDDDLELRWEIRELKLSKYDYGESLLLSVTLMPEGLNDDAHMWRMGFFVSVEQNPRNPLSVSKMMRACSFWLRERFTSEMYLTKKGKQSLIRARQR